MQGGLEDGWALGHGRARRPAHLLLRLQHAQGQLEVDCKLVQAAAGGGGRGEQADELERADTSEGARAPTRARIRGRALAAFVGGRRTWRTPRSGGCCQGSWWPAFGTAGVRRGSDRLPGAIEARGRQCAAPGAHLGAVLHRPVEERVCGLQGAAGQLARALGHHQEVCTQRGPGAKRSARERADGREGGSRGCPRALTEVVIHRQQAGRARGVPEGHARDAGVDLAKGALAHTQTLELRGQARGVRGENDEMRRGRRNGPPWPALPGPFCTRRRSRETL